MQDNNYTAEQIQVLEGLEAVRKRPGMYIGSTSARGLHHLVYEIVDNSIDEALAGYCNNIWVTIGQGNVITVEDDGRGIPVDIQQQTGLPAVEVVFTILHAGGKFGGSGYKVSGGLHGVGASVVNALSEYLEVEVFQNGNVYFQRYERGARVAPLAVTGKTEKVGSRVTFLPDGEIFDEVEFDFDTLLTRLREQLRIAQAYFEVGLSPRLDVLQAEVDVSEAESLLIEAENTQATTLARLNTLLGFDATAVNTYTGTLKEVGFRYTLEQCLELAYRQRPDLYVAQKAVEIARKSQKEVQSDYYPQIEGYYSMTQSGNTPGMQRSGENGSHVTNWEVGAQATWNVFEWGTTYYADKQAGWQVTKMRYEQENLKLEVGYDIKSKYLAVQEARKRIAVAQNSVAQATEAYNVALARYHEHVGTNFDVLDASANLTSAQSSLTGAKADYLTALSQIYVAMGEYHPDLLREGGPARRK